MKQILQVLFAVAALASVISFSTTYRQIIDERNRLTSDLERRSVLLADTFNETIEPNFVNKSEAYLQNVVEKFQNRERLAGLMIFDNKEAVIAASSTLSLDGTKTQKMAANVMDENTYKGEFYVADDKRFYLLAVPIHEGDRVVGALLTVHTAAFIDTRLNEIWQNNLIRLFIQIFLLTLTVAFTLRFIIVQPIRTLVASLNSPLMNADIPVKGGLNNLIFGPLTKEIMKLKSNLIEARIAIREEARSSLERLDAPWTKDRLREFIKDLIKDRTIVLVSNREPYIHNKKNNKIEVQFPASGMVTAIEPIMRACGGTWIAQASGSADAETVNSHHDIEVPPDDPKYTLHRVWLTDEEVKGYYDGFSNEALWPLFHHAHTRPIFRKDDWDQYVAVNQKFAKEVLKKIKNLRRPIVLIQDFHFALLPEMIKAERPGATIGIFWHIPWVSSETFSICPWKKEILKGMLGADLLGFHTQLHCNNFIETVSREVESLIDYEQHTITRNEHVSHIKPFPISIAFTNGYGPGEAFETDLGEAILKKYNVNSKYIALGVDRLDYTKGILERLKSIEIFLTDHPTYIENLTFVQISAPSREKVLRYQEFSQEVETEVDRINNRFRTRNWKPIVFIHEHKNREEIDSLYRLSDVLLVTSLHDGMNLVAKEFVAARSDKRGVLILSQFAGAARELADALIVNPYDGESGAKALFKAITMSEEEQAERMEKLRNAVKRHNVYWWSAEFLKSLLTIE